PDLSLFVVVGCLSVSGFLDSIPLRLLFRSAHPKGGIGDGINPLLPPWRPDGACRFIALRCLDLGEKEIEQDMDRLMGWAIRAEPWRFESLLFLRNVGARRLNPSTVWLAKPSLSFGFPGTPWNRLFSFFAGFPFCKGTPAGLFHK